jgi:hypothetical protein
MTSDGSIIKFKYNKEEVSNLSGFIGENDFAEMLNYFFRESTGTPICLQFLKINS